MSKDRRILVVEDVAEMREMLGQFLAQIPGWKVCGLVPDLVHARLEFSRNRPDVVLLDEVLPGESSLDWVEEIQKYGVPLAIIFMTGMVNRHYPLPAGVLGRLAKPSWESWKEDLERFAQMLGAL